MGIDFKEAIERQKRDQDAWIRKHRLLIDLLKISPIEAMQSAKQIEKLQAHMIGYLKVILPVFLAVIAIAFFLFFYSRFTDDITKSLCLAANYLGLAGTFFGSYGFLFNRKGLEEPRTSFNSYNCNISYPESCFKAIFNHINDHNEKHLQDSFSSLKVELRKQISLFMAFILIAASFILQALLQFF